MSRTKLTPEQIEQKLSELSGWEVVDGKLHKSYKFSNFTKAFSWMTAVALKAEKMDHHPEWFNVYNTVRVDLATHDAQGITELDFTLAAFMDQAC